MSIKITYTKKSKNLQKGTMGDLLNFNDHIDKTHNKQRYLGYEKGKVLEETIKELIEKIPDIPDETIISYFTNIVKGKIPVMDDKPFHTNCGNYIFF